MKINGFGGPHETYPVSKSEESKATEKTKVAGGADRVEISADAKRIARLAQAAKQLPEIRQERVAELAEAIQGGVYEVEPRVLANSILEFEDALR
jgi:negative regulator of flagellin synthesis FlgM